MLNINKFLSLNKHHFCLKQVKNNNYSKDVLDNILMLLFSSLLFNSSQLSNNAYIQYIHIHIHCQLCRIR